jgi:hypothetical protein
MSGDQSLCDKLDVSKESPLTSPKRTTNGRAIEHGEKKEKSKPMREKKEFLSRISVSRGEKRTTRTVIPDIFRVH